MRTTNFLIGFCLGVCAMMSCLMLSLASADGERHALTAPEGVKVDAGLLSEELIAAGLIERGVPDQFVRVDGQVVEVSAKPGVKRAQVVTVLAAHDGRSAGDRELDALAAIEAAWASATPAQKDMALRAVVRMALRQRRPR